MKVGIRFQPLSSDQQQFPAEASRRLRGFAAWRDTGRSNILGIQEYIREPVCFDLPLINTLRNAFTKIEWVGCREYCYVQRIIQLRLKELEQTLQTRRAWQWETHSAEMILLSSKRESTKS
jgi:hypothetical protein